MRGWWLCVVAAGACGKPAGDRPAPPPVAAVDASIADASPPPDAAPRRFAARAELDPVTGSNLKTVSFVFLQVEGEAPSMSSGAPVSGLAAGKYHLVIHEGRACGEGAVEAGAAWPGSIPIAIARGAPAIVEVPRADVRLDGDRAIAGHTLVLHADARGKPGRVLGCGAIFSRSPTSP